MNIKNLKEISENIFSGIYIDNSNSFTKSNESNLIPYIKIVDIEKKPSSKIHFENIEQKIKIDEIENVNYVNNLDILCLIKSKNPKNIGRCFLYKSKNNELAMVDNNIAVIKTKNLIDKIEQEKIAMSLAIYIENNKNFFKKHTKNSLISYIKIDDLKKMKINTKIFDQKNIQIFSDMFQKKCFFSSFWEKYSNIAEKINFSLLMTKKENSKSYKKILEKYQEGLDCIQNINEKINKYIENVKFD